MRLFKAPVSTKSLQRDLQSRIKRCAIQWVDIKCGRSPINFLTKLKLMELMCFIILALCQPMDSKHAVPIK
jgi:hypothetical protein